MRIVLTGGAGYIGSHTLVELLPLGHEICVIDNYANSSPEALRRVRELCDRPFQIEEADVRNCVHLTAIFDAFRPDVVIHFAGLKSVGEGEARPVEYYETNVAGTLALLSAMTAAGCKRIIFSSSATVYGEPEYLPLDERHPCRPASVYGRTKYIAEQILADWAQASSGTSAILLRYFNPVGAHKSGLIGEDPQGIPNNLMPFIAQVAVGRRESLAIFGDDYDTRDGSGLRDYIHVVDLARAHIAAMNFSAGHQGVMTFNVGTGTGTTVKEMLAAYSRACGRDLPSRLLDRRSGDVAASYADASRAEEMLGWRATHSLEDMCMSSWKWQSENPAGYHPSEKG